MKQSKIKVGCTYRNRGKGMTERTVVDIGNVKLRNGHKAVWQVDRWSVLYEQDCEYHVQPLNTFAQWAGSEVKDED